MPHASRPTVTLRDVAAAAGVSVATASRVLNGSSRKVAPEYQQRVLAAATALRYTADATARAMRRVSDAIALVADDLTTPSISLVVAAMEKEARESGAFVTVSPTMGAPERQLETVRSLRALRPRALVLTTGRIDADVLGGRIVQELRAYENDGGRVVLVGDTNTDFDSISFGNRAAACAMGRYIAGTGHQDVAILAGPRHQAAAAARTRGFVEGLEEGGIATGQIRVVHGTLSRQGGYDAAHSVLAGGAASTDAVIAVNDTVAIGALAALRESGVGVPGDLSVTGFDDIQMAVDVTPRLTTVAVPLAQAGAEAIQLAMKPRTTSVHLLMHGTLVVRESSAPRSLR